MRGRSVAQASEARALRTMATMKIGIQLPVAACSALPTGTSSEATPFDIYSRP
jgi:hypothetical protein